MDNRNQIYLDGDQSLCAVKFKGKWRFFFDDEPMFILDFTAYDDYTPVPGEYRYGILVVNENNAEQWMAALAGEVTPRQLHNVYSQVSKRRVELTFVIDFDKKLWVGQRWKMDQSALQDYQPKDWLAMEDDLEKYLPPEIRGYWTWD